MLSEQDTGFFQVTIQYGHGKLVRIGQRGICTEGPKEVSDISKRPSRGMRKCGLSAHSSRVEIRTKLD